MTQQKRHGLAYFPLRLPVHVLIKLDGVATLSRVLRNHCQRSNQLQKSIRPTNQWSTRNILLSRQSEECFPGETWDTTSVEQERRALPTSFTWGITTKVPFQEQARGEKIRGGELPVHEVPCIMAPSVEERESFGGTVGAPKAMGNIMVETYLSPYISNHNGEAFYCDIKHMIHDAPLPD